jgi:anaerobic ribonucleoside-triphosphate reductase activating protein
MMKTTGQESTRLNIASLVTKTRALGPGIRAAIWVQGCPLHCHGCVAPDWIPFRPAMVMSPEIVIERLDIPSLDGITYSGGEPMEQAEALAFLSREIRKIKNINFICFTGYRYERLMKDPPNGGVNDLLSELDVLIDGPYIESQNDSVGLRGSSNQRIIHLTSRLQANHLDTQKRSVEITVQDGELSFVGIPTPGIKSAMELASQVGKERMMHYERI